MIRCIVVDDEPLAISLICSYIEKTNDLQCIATFSTAVEAFLFLHNSTIDLIFLDVEMPGITGIKFIKSLKTPPKVIFVTAYTDFAVEAFELAAVDYLLKPVSFDRFIKAVQRLSVAANSPHESADVVTSIFLKVDRKLVKIDLASIKFIEGAGDYCKVHLQDRTYLTYTTMNKIQQILPPEDFTRIHRSTIIRHSLTDYIEGNFLQLGHHRLAIGQTFREEILQKLKG